MEDDWGDADMTYLYFKTIGVKPTVGEKVFLEMYWLDPETGFTGLAAHESKICESEADAEAEGFLLIEILGKSWSEGPKIKNAPQVCCLATRLKGLLSLVIRTFD
jgi:hypothetical protein